MKNWFVGVEQKTKKHGASTRTKKRDEKNIAAGITKKIVKKKYSIQSCVDYLLSKKHENHIHTNIYEIRNARNDLSNIFDEVESVRLKNAATSFCASIPADLYHPTKKEWSNIYDLTMQNYCDSLNTELEKLEKAHHKKSIPVDDRRNKEFHLDTERFSQRLDLEEMKRLSICVIHDDRDKPLMIGKTGGSQMNLLISNVIDNKVVKLISQKNGVELFKKSYVNAVKNELGLDPAQYVTYENRLAGSEHKDFYAGPSNVDLLKIDKSTPRKKRKSQELRLKEYKKSFYKAANEKLESVVEREKDINKKLEQVPKARKIIKTANEAIKIKNKANTDFTRIRKQEKIAKKSLNEINEKIENNQKWLYNIVKSEIFKDYVESFRKTSLDFYLTVKSIVKNIETTNKEFIDELDKKNPVWLSEEKIRREKELEELETKQKNRHSSNVFVEDIEVEKIEIVEENEIKKKKSFLDIFKR